MAPLSFSHNSGPPHPASFKIQNPPTFVQAEPGQYDPSQAQNFPGLLSLSPFAYDSYSDLTTQPPPSTLKPIISVGPRARVICPGCMKGVSKASLARHRNSHCWAAPHAAGAEARTCQYCGKLFSRPDALRRHYRRNKPCFGFFGNHAAMLPTIAEAGVAAISKDVAHLQG